MRRKLLFLCLFPCFFSVSTAWAQYACDPGELPELSDAYQLDIITIKPVPGRAMVPGMEVVSAGGAAVLMSEPSWQSEERGELNTGVSRRILGVAVDESGDIWYMLRGNEQASRRVWCRGNLLVPDPNRANDVSFLVWQASECVSNGQMSKAHRIIENTDGIGIISEEDDGVLILIYNPFDPVTSDHEEMYWQQDCIFLFAGTQGFSYEVVFNVASVCEISPSGEYFAVGADGTGVSRGPVYVVDTETCVKYRYDLPGTGVGATFNWFDDDFFLVQSVGPRPVLEDWYLGNQPWINYSYMTEAEGAPENVVLIHGNRAWMILPEDRCYNYRMSSNYGVCEEGILFDVVASPNVIPSLAGIESYSDFSEWIDSTGGQSAAFPQFEFLIDVDTRNMSVSCSRTHPLDE